MNTIGRQSPPTVQSTSSSINPNHKLRCPPLRRAYEPDELVYYNSNYPVAMYEAQQQHHHVGRVNFFSRRPNFRKTSWYPSKDVNGQRGCQSFQNLKGDDGSVDVSMPNKVIVVNDVQRIGSGRFPLPDMRRKNRARRQDAFKQNSSCYEEQWSQEQIQTGFSYPGVNPFMPHMSMFPPQAIAATQSECPQKITIKQDEDIPPRFRRKNREPESQNCHDAAFNFTGKKAAHQSTENFQWSTKQSSRNQRKHYHQQESNQQIPLSAYVVASSMLFPEKSEGSEMAPANDDDDDVYKAYRLSSPIDEEFDFDLQKSNGTTDDGNELNGCGSQSWSDTEMDVERDAISPGSLCESLASFGNEGNLMDDEAIKLTLDKLEKELEFEEISDINEWFDKAHTKNELKVYKTKDFLEWARLYFNSQLRRKVDPKLLDWASRKDNSSLTSKGSSGISSDYEDTDISIEDDFSKRLSLEQAELNGTKNITMD